MSLWQGFGLLVIQEVQESFAPYYFLNDVASRQRTYPMTGTIAIPVLRICDLRSRIHAHVIGPDF